MSDTDLGYYQSFVDITNKVVETNKDMMDKFKDPGFRHHISSKHIDARLIIEVSPYLIHTLLKPQELIHAEKNYYIANDIFTNLHYICYKDLLMIDIDEYKNCDKIDICDKLPHCICQIENVINDWEQDEIEVKARCVLWKKKICQCNNTEKILRYRIFKSRGGYHIFIISHKMDRHNKIAMQLMIEAECDFFYIIYSYIRGWCVRLNKKQTENKDNQLYTYYGDVIKGKFVMYDDNSLATNRIEELETYINIHMNLCGIFENVGECKSRNI